MRTENLVAITEVTDRAAFGRLAGEWNALVRETRDEPFLRHEFFRIWLDNFAPRASLRVLLGRDVEGKLVAALPLIEERGSILGAPVRRLIAAANAHSCRFDLIARDTRAAGQMFFAHLATRGGWDVLVLQDVREGGGGWSIYRTARDAGFPAGALLSLASPFFALPPTPGEMEARLRSKFKANLRRRRRKLEAMGEVALEHVTGGPDLYGRLEEGYALEAFGWKGRRGSAIALEDRRWGFYTELARAASYRGYLSLYFLRVGGRAVAFHYGLQVGGRYYLLKPAYDETMSECSPGQLLMEEVVRHSIARGVKEFDFLGPDMPWKREWADMVRPHYGLWIFPDTPYGRALHAYRFRVARTARKFLSGWRP